MENYASSGIRHYLVGFMRFHEPPRFPRGFRCASRNVGLKPDARDLAILVSEVDAAAAAVFTRNQFPGAPIILGRETIKRGVLRAIVANSKVSNVATGVAGVEHARRMAAAAAREIGTTAEHVLVSSTGVIGVPLPIEKIERGITGITSELQDDPIVAAEGIMTTDTHPKALSTSAGDATITWIAKGAGMIEPNMATMLSYILTDASFDAPTLDRMLRDAVHVSFNMLSVDSDTSTSDTCVIMANGLAGGVDQRAFVAALTAGCIRMTEMLARDDAGARRIAKTILNSLLINTMVHGADPNVGRILMAVGKCIDCEIAPSKTCASVNGFEVVRNGERVNFDDNLVRAALATSIIDLVVEVGVGMASATAYGCDLSKGYIAENAAYYSS